MMSTRKISLQTFTASDSLSVFVIIAVMLAAALIAKPSFLDGQNVASLIRVFSITAVIGLSQMIVMATGGMNVAIGATGGMCAALGGILMKWLGVDVIPSLLIVLAIGAVSGLINGFFTLRSGGGGVASFLATLATASTFGGITLALTKGRPIYGIPDALLAFGNGTFLGLPVLFYIMAIVSVATLLFFRYMKTGRELLAFGGNIRAAELYGVSKVKVIMVAHVLGSLLAALAGMMTVVRIQAAQTNIGADWMLMSMAAPLLGGTAANGGKVNIPGTILGAVVLALIANALVQFKVDVYWNDLTNGLVILIVATINHLRSIRKA